MYARIYKLMACAKEFVELRVSVEGLLNLVFSNYFY